MKFLKLIIKFKGGTNYQYKPAQPKPSQPANNYRINNRVVKPEPKPVVPQPAKPTPLKIIKVDDADLQPQNTLEDVTDDDIPPGTGSQVKIKKIDKNFFLPGGNKKPIGGKDALNKIKNGITFMGSQIASFNDVPTINSKIVLPNKFGGGNKVPSIGRLDNFPFPPPFAKPGNAPSMSKIFDANVIFNYFLINFLMLTLDLNFQISTFFSGIKLFILIIFLYFY